MQRKYFFLHKDQEGKVFVEQFDSYEDAENDWKDTVNAELDYNKYINSCNITPIMEGVIPEGFIINEYGDIERSSNVEPRIS